MSETKTSTDLIYLFPFCPWVQYKKCNKDQIGSGKKRFNTLAMLSGYLNEISLSLTTNYNCFNKR